MADLEEPTITNGEPVPTQIPEGATGPKVPEPDTVEVKTPRVDPTKEYVAGAPNLLLASYVRALPMYVDDITRDFGTDLYDRMLLDDQVHSSVSILVLTALADSCQVGPAVADEEDPDFEYAKEISDFCMRMIEGLEQPFLLWLFEMGYTACAGGHKISEKVWEVEEEGPDAGRLVLSKLKPKRRETVAFVVDVYENVIGLLAIIPGQSATLATGTVMSDKDVLANLLPREKFAVLSLNTKDGDPRGRTLLRPAYDPWWRKQSTKIEHMRFIAQTAGAGIIGTTPEGATADPVFDVAGNPIGFATITPESRMVATLELWRNGSVAAFPYGSTVQLLHSGSTGQAFLDAMAAQDRQITMAILCQTLATMEGEHQARAAAQTHENRLDVVTTYLRTQICEMARADLFRPAVEYNFGSEAARRFTPKLILGGTPQQDWPSTAGATAQLVTSGFLDPSQYAALDKKLGLPPRPAPPPPKPVVPLGPDGMPLPFGGGSPPPNPAEPPLDELNLEGEPPPTPTEEQKNFSAVGPADITKARLVWRALRKQ
jgi:hypothetical protein